MRFYIKTLGCKMNQLDSARVRAALLEAGYEDCASEQDADLVLVNSCTVTAQSDRKSRQAAGAALGAGRMVRVLGCGVRADRAGWEQRFPGLPLFESDADLLGHFGLLDREIPFPVTSSTRLPIAIQTGCDDHCSFCITRTARGPHRNRPAADIVRQINEAFDAGVMEVVLTGINLAAWGAGNTRRPARARLHVLLERILVETAMPRIRLSSLGPQYLHAGFFDLLADPRICEHLHLSVQSGSPGVLARMQRGHDEQQVLRVAERARAVRPQVALAADFICGFPGETDAEALETESLVAAIDFAKLHVFPFSARQGTPAARMDQQVDGERRRERAGRLRELGRAGRQRFIESQIGHPAQVLVERDGTGLTSNYIRLRIAGARKGRLVDTSVEREWLADRF